MPIRKHARRDVSRPYICSSETFFGSNAAAIVENFLSMIAGSILLASPILLSAFGLVRP